MSETNQTVAPRELLDQGVEWLQKVTKDPRGSIEELGGKVDIEALRTRAKSGVEKLQGQVTGRTSDLRGTLEEQLQQLRQATTELNLETLKERGQSLSGKAQEKAGEVRTQVESRLGELKSAAETRGTELKSKAQGYAERVKTESLREEVESRIEVIRGKLAELNQETLKEVVSENTEKVRGRAEELLAQARESVDGLNAEALRERAEGVRKQVTTFGGELLETAAKRSGLATTVEVRKLPSKKEIEKLVQSIDLSTLARATQLEALAKSADLSKIASKEDVEKSLGKLADQLKNLTDEVRALNKSLARTSEAA